MLKAAETASESARIAERACEAGGPLCFVAGTPVATSNRTTSIEHVQLGDKVWSRDPATGKTELRRVAHLYRHQANETITVGLAAHTGGPIVQTLTATPGHRFFVVGRGAVSLS